MLLPLVTASAATVRKCPSALAASEVFEIPLFFEVVNNLPTGLGQRGQTFHRQRSHAADFPLRFQHATYRPSSGAIAPRPH